MPDSGLEPTPPAALGPLADEILQLTYRELAERLGMSTVGARALARRQQWPVSRDDSGRSLVLVAAAALSEERHRRSEPDRADGRAMAARVAEMVQALKAEAPAPAADAAEAAHMVGLMRQFLDMYERERLNWFGALNDLNAQLDDAKSEIYGLLEAQERLTEAHQRERDELFAARDARLAAQQQERAELAKARAAASAAEAKHEQALIQHQRALSDLATVHNDQRSLWLLERRRLETMVEALERGRALHWPKLRLQLASARRIAFVVLAVALTGIALARDTGPAALYRFRPAQPAAFGAAAAVLPPGWTAR